VILGAAPAASELVAIVLVVIARAVTIATRLWRCAAYDPAGRSSPAQEHR
jgi:hypothetical protein